MKENNNDYDESNSEENMNDDVDNTDNNLNDNIVDETEEFGSGFEYNSDDLYESFDEEQDIKAMGLTKKIVAVFASPSKLFRNVSQAPNILMPLLLVIIISIGTSLLSVPLADIVMEEQYIAYERNLEGGEQYANLLRTQMQVMEDQGMNLSGSFTVVASVISILLMMPIGIFIGALLLLVLCKIFKVDINFKTSFSMYTHISILTAIGGLLAGILSLVTQNTTNLLSLAVFIPNGDMFNLLYLVLGNLSVFSIWGYILTYFAVGSRPNANKSKALIIAIIFAVVNIVAFIAINQFSINSIRSTAEMLLRQMQ